VKYQHHAPEAALRKLPVLDRPARLPRRQLQKFRFPLAMPARVAMFEGGFSADGAIRQFAAREASQLHDYVPEALVLPLPVALTLADHKQRKLLNLPTLTTAVVVLTSLNDILAEHHRTILWRAFGVPLFEQLQGWDGAVIARECEVHDGLHIDETAVILEKDGEELVATQLTSFEDPILRVRTGLTAAIVTEHCECGAETPRLRNLASMHTKARMAVAS
jgi:phenylacetate-coenzyme A ligase PaaK-like adenylate-forming protein